MINILAIFTLSFILGVIFIINGCDPEYGCYLYKDKLKIAYIEDIKIIKDVCYECMTLCKNEIDCCNVYFYICVSLNITFKYENKTCIYKAYKNNYQINDKYRIIINYNSICEPFDNISKGIFWMGSGFLCLSGFILLIKFAFFIFPKNEYKFKFLQDL